jgi:predicted amidophosphoribosyltransferase
VGFDEIRNTVGAALLDAWALVQPVDCLGCGAPDRALCRTCRAAIRPAPALVTCDAPPGVPVIAAADYAGPVRGALLALKEDARLDAARSLAELLAAALRTLSRQLPPPQRVAEVAWIPSRRSALRRRGYDPVHEILSAARIPTARVLAARPGERAQKSLARHDRLAARERFRARGDLAGRRFVLVDDVVTTGSTLADGVRAIRSAGGAVIAAVALAAPDLDTRRTPFGAG